MTRIPDFSVLELAEGAATPVASSATVPWLTPEGIPVKSAYSEADLAGIDFLDTWPGIAPYLQIGRAHV